MLEIRNISKEYNSKKVLKNISFNVEKGRTFGIIGPNGAGKTTTLRILLGIITASSGEILFQKKNLDQKYQNITGYLPEERGLYPKSNVLNTLIYLAQLKGLKHSEAVVNTKYWLDRLRLEDYQKYHIEDLSKGNQQKVQFITAISHSPQILVLDEPFSGFDPVNQTIFKEVIEEMKSDKYIIISTHLMDLAENLCDDIFMIDNGDKILSGDLSEILESNVENIYQIDFQNEIDSTILEYLRKFNFEKINGNSISLEIDGNEINNILKDIIKFAAISGFKKIEPSLHQLFLSNVDQNREI